MDSDYINDLEELNPKHFWFRAKEKYLQELIKRPKAKILDLGCGNGRVMRSFVERGYKVAGVDINEKAINFCRKKGYTVYKCDLQIEIPNIESAPNYIIALDFVEHVANPIALFQNLKRISNYRTKLIVTVPSYQLLFSNWDRSMGHVKRYRLPQLCDELENGGWQISKATYIHFIPLIPAILIRKFFNPIVGKRLRNHGKKNRSKFFNPNRILNNLVFLCYYPEFLLFNPVL